MDIKTMSVNVEDKSIAINGEGYICPAEHFPSIDQNITSLQWHPNRQGRCKGSIARHVGGGEAIDEFTLLEPFVEAWEKAKQQKEARVAEERTRAQVMSAGTQAIVVTEDADLPRFLRSPEPAPIAPDMQTRLTEFTERAHEAVEAARQSIEASRSDSQRIDALEQRLTAIEGILQGVAEHFDKDRGGQG